MTPLQALAELVAAQEQMAAAQHKTRDPYWDWSAGANADDVDPVGTAQSRLSAAWADARAVLAQGEEQPKPEGVAVHLFGDFRPIAWFAEFDDLAEAWCREHAFGRWLTWRSTAPVMIPLTPEEAAECERRGKELAAKLAPKDPTS